MVTTRSSARKTPSVEFPLLNGHANGDGHGNGYSNGNGSSKKRHSNANGVNGRDEEHDSKRQKVAEPVDRTKWRMKSDDGRHTWHYLDDDDAVKEWPQSYADKWYLGLPLVRLPAFSSIYTQHADLPDLYCRTSLPWSLPRPPSMRSATA